MCLHVARVSTENQLGFAVIAHAIDAIFNKMTPDNTGWSLGRHFDYHTKLGMNTTWCNERESANEPKQTRI
jgi:hypothetical protein